MVVVLQVLGMFVYSSYSSYRYPAHFGSLDHYVSFLLAPATAKGPFLVMLIFRHESKDMGSKGLFYFKHLTIYTWVPFCIGLNRPFRPCFGNGNLYSF